MNTDIKLKYNYGYQWYIENGIYVKGYLFDQDDVLWEGAALTSYFSEVQSDADFRHKLEVANGMFSVIIDREDVVFMGVDRSRTFPLFYCIQNSRLRIADKADVLSTGGLSEQNVAEFLYTGYVTGRDTLLENVFQLESGSCIAFQDGELRPSCYFQCERKVVHDNSVAVLEQELVSIMDKVGERLVRKLNGRTAVIPLSGGYDSRIIAVLLRKLNYPNVMTYTYGVRSSPEVAISKKVAEQFGFPWHFIEYRKTLINGFVNSPEFQEYYPFASNCVSGFFTQDYFAVRYLKAHHMVPETAVFMPGHKSNAALDAYYVIGMNEHNVVAWLLRKRYYLRQRPDAFAERIQNQLSCPEPVDNFLNWSSKEFLSKFLVNSNRIYEYFGFEHLMPLWDRELTDFILNLEDSWRTNYKLLWQVWFKYYFEPFQVAYKKKEYPFLMQKAVGAVNRTKRFLYTDMNNFKYIAKMFLENEPLDVHWDSVKVNINTIQSTWYIKQLEKKFK